MVSDWKREPRFAYNLHSDVDQSGRFVAFQFSVEDGPTGVYLRDMRSRRITRLDVWITGDQPAPGTARDERIYRFGSGVPSISDNGRFVAFHSTSPFLVPGDVNRAADVFLYDRKTARLRLVSATSEGIQADGASFHPSVSATGRFVAFSSRARNLSDARSHLFEVYVKDIRTSEVRLASTGMSSGGRLEGAAATGSIPDAGLDGSASASSISADGTRVAFQSDASNHVPEDHNGVSDAFVADLSTGKITRVSVTSDGDELVPFVYEESAGVYHEGAGDVALSGNGRVVAFATHANGLVPEDQNDNVDIYVHDLGAQATTRVTTTSDGGDGYRREDRECGNNGECFGFIASHSPTLSHDGRYVAFVSGAPLLDGAGADPRGSEEEDLFVHDRKTGVTVLVNRTYRGTPATGYNIYAGSISRTGRWISFSIDGRVLRARRGRSENGDVYLQRLPIPLEP